MKSIDSVVVIVNDWVYIIDGQMIFIFQIIIRICLFFLAPSHKNRHEDFTRVIVYK